MRLTELEPSFLRITDERTEHRIDNIEDAQGILFLCPKCFVENKGRVGTHSVVCWFKDRGVPDDRTPGPGRWDVVATEYEDLTLSPSVHLSGPGCGWHGWIQNGEAIL